MVTVFQPRLQPCWMPATRAATLEKVSASFMHVRTFCAEEDAKAIGADQSCRKHNKSDNQHVGKMA